MQRRRGRSRGISSCRSRFSCISGVRGHQQVQRHHHNHGDWQSRHERCCRLQHGQQPLRLHRSAWRCWSDRRDWSHRNSGNHAVGTVTTGSPGSSATVTNSGTSGAATFDFAIPRGCRRLERPAQPERLELPEQPQPRCRHGRLVQQVHRLRLRTVARAAQRPSTSQFLVAMWGLQTTGAQGPQGIQGPAGQDADAIPMAIALG